MESEEFFEDPEFEVGDKVIFECAGESKNRPRYDFNDDGGETGVWAQGTVIDVNSRVIKTEYTIENYVGTGYCKWPNVDHPEYEPGQWYQEGYLQILQKRAVCECGAEKTYGPETTHVSWCAKYE